MKAHVWMGLVGLALAQGGCLVGDPNPYANVAGAGGSGSGGGAGFEGLRSGSPAGTPIAPGIECSVSSSDTVDVTFQNQSASRNLTVYWVDFSCAENLSGALPAMGSYPVQTYAAHPWRFRDDAGQLVYEYLPSALDAQTVPLP